MAYIIKSLGTNQISATGTVDAYTVPSNRSALVTSIRLVNSQPGSTPEVAVLVKPSGAASTPRQLGKVALVLTTGTMRVVDDGVSLGQGDTIQVSVVGLGAQFVEYSVFGLERD